MRCVDHIKRTKAFQRSAIREKTSTTKTRSAAYASDHLRISNSQAQTTAEAKQWVGIRNDSGTDHHDTTHQKLRSRRTAEHSASQKSERLAAETQASLRHKPGAKKKEETQALLRYTAEAVGGGTSIAPTTLCTPTRPLAQQAKIKVAKSDRAESPSTQVTQSDLADSPSTHSPPTTRPP